MGMVTEMIFAIAQSTIALAAVSKFDRCIRLVGDTADDAFMLWLLRVSGNLNRMLNAAAL